ncbi:PREDICTED: fibroblast growth factor receptor-like 1 [Priapulus caudatus]|uniref:Fibroblast growth factor receptor-like 1 n=1 Tax=Priapulus caudatus TaxID=37621 RepID=A0ABM1DVW4_PRICU|nr:PREDICTED: fibroblast growth factor receptor-like 1 [Priapulus caudatus]XP_014664085.1 PREDICTED: fibroblast growth factor receptor-like 1 [Priapulus caudatus]
MTMGTNWPGVFTTILIITCLQGAVYGGIGEPPYVFGKLVPVVEARVGDTKKLPCPVEGSTPFITWQKNGEQVNPVTWGKRFKIIHQGLRIKDIVPEDAGRYLCKAVNGFGTLTINVTLAVLGDDDRDYNYKYIPPTENMVPSLPDTPDISAEGAKPEFTESGRTRSQHVMHKIGTIVRLKCTAKGNPPPDIVWLKNDQVLHLNNEDKQSGRWTLVLESIQIEDSGTYTCRVSNIHGAINATYTLEVVERVRQEKPLMTGEDPVNTTVEYGGTASFQCKVKSAVKPHVQWLKEVKEGENVTSTLEVGNDKYKVLPAGEIRQLEEDGPYLNKLVISGVTEKDSGMYICLGANENGYSFKSAFLTVLSPTLYEEGIPLALIIVIPVVLVLLFAAGLLVCRYRCTAAPPSSANVATRPRTQLQPPSKTVAGAERTYYSEVPQVVVATQPKVHRSLHPHKQQQHHYYPRTSPHPYYSDQMSPHPYDMQSQQSRQIYTDFST